MTQNLRLIMVKTANAVLSVFYLFFFLIALVGKTQVNGDRGQKMKNCAANVAERLGTKRHNYAGKGAHAEPSTVSF